MSNVTLKDGQGVAMYKPPKKKKMWWRYLLMWFVGFLSAILVIGGTGLVFTTAFSSKQVMGMFGLDADNILQSEYQNMSILKLVTALPSLNYETLGDIDKVTPAIKNTLLNDINPALKKEVYYEFKWDEIKNKPFKLNSSSPRPEEEYDHAMSLTQYIPYAMKTGIKIGNFFRNSAGQIQADGILKYIIYPIVCIPGVGEEPDKYVVNTDATDDELVSLQDIISGGNGFFDTVKKAIVIGDVIDTSKSPFLEQVATWTLADFNDTNIKNLKIGELISGGGAFVEQIKTLGWTINDLTDANIMKLQIGPLFEGVTGNVLVNTIKAKNWSIENLIDSNNIMGLQIQEVIDTNSPSASSFIKEIGQYSFNQIMAPGFVDGLELGKIFPNAQGVLKALADKTYIGEDEKEHKYTVGDLNKSERILALKVIEIFPDIKSDELLYSFRNDTLEDISKKDINDVLIKDAFPKYTTVPIINAVVNIKGKDTAKIGDLTNQTVINQIPLSAVIDAGDSLVLKALVKNNTTIGSLSTSIGELTLKDVIDVGTDPNAMIYKIAHSEAFENCSITNLGSNFSLLKISDLFTIDNDTPQVLIALANKGTTLASLSTDMKSLEVRDVMEIYPGDIFKRTIGVDEFEYYILHNDGWELVPSVEFDEEYNAYYSSSGYLALNEAKEFTGTYVPSKDVEDLSTAKARDSLYAVGSTKINNSASMITALKNSLCLKDVVDIKDDSPQVLKSLKYTKLKDIPATIASLKLSDIITISSTSSPIMNLLAGVTVFGDGKNNLQSALENLNIIDLFGGDIYETGEKADSRNSISISFTPLASDVDSTTKEIKVGSNADVLAKAITTNSKKTTNYFVYDNYKNNYSFNYVYTNDSYKASYIDPAIKAAYKYVTGDDYSITETFDETHNTLTVSTENYEVKIEALKSKKIKAIYWFMFSESTEPFSDVDHFFVLKKGYTYTINDMSHFTDNMVSHIKEESLESLYDAGFITTALPFDSVLKSNIYGVTNPYGGRTVGSLNINELIDLINMLLPLITNPTT